MAPQHLSNPTNPPKLSLIQLSTNSNESKQEMKKQKRTLPSLRRIIRQTRRRRPHNLSILIMQRLRIERQIARPNLIVEREVECASQEGTGVFGEWVEG